MFLQIKTGEVFLHGKATRKTALIPSQRKSYPNERVFLNGKP
jgi:hypothetical protein